MKTNYYRDVIIGMAGFIKWGWKNGQSSNYLLDNLSHDIFGILKDDEGFSPRTSSYKKYLSDKYALEE